MWKISLKSGELIKVNRKLICQYLLSPYEEEALRDNRHETTIVHDPNAHLESWIKLKVLMYNELLGIKTEFRIQGIRRLANFYKRSIIKGQEEHDIDMEINYFFPGRIIINSFYRFGAYFQRNTLIFRDIFGGK